MNSSEPDPSVTDELRSLLDTLAARAEPLLNRMGSHPAGQHPATCHWCPLCASVAVLRGQRPELAVRAAEHAAGLLAVLRAAIQDHPATDQHHHEHAAASGDAGGEPQHSAEPSPPRRDRVQKIELRRQGNGGSRGSQP